MFSKTFNPQGMNNGRKTKKTFKAKKMGQYISKNNNNKHGNNNRYPDMVRPSSPPRGLANILRSDSLTEEFHVFLAELDADAEEGRLRQLWLEFVRAVRDLRDKTEAATGDKKLVVIHLKNMEDAFFNVKDARKKVALTNPSLWTACHNLCAKAKANGDMSPLWKAHDEVIRRLDDIHGPFLLQRYEENSGTTARVLGEAVQSCLL